MKVMMATRLSSGIEILAVCATRAIHLPTSSSKKTIPYIGQMSTAMSFIHRLAPILFPVSMHQYRMMISIIVGI
jgi:hypothetical protein